MTFTEAIASGFRKYVTFQGRAARSEYWFWFLFSLLVSIATAAADLSFFPGGDVSPLNTLASLGLFLPGIAVGVRRLHDLDRTGWWMLLPFTIIGTFLLIYWFCLRGTEGPNRFGPDPLAAFLAPA